MRHYVGMAFLVPSELAEVAASALRTGFIRALRVDPEEPIFSTEGDAGWFGPESVVWRVHSDLSTLVGGLRALLYQTLHPLNKVLQVLFSLCNPQIL